MLLFSAIRGRLSVAHLPYWLAAQSWLKLKHSLKSLCHACGPDAFRRRQLAVADEENFGTTVSSTVVSLEVRYYLVGRVRPVLVKRNDDFSWCRRAVPADSGSIRARQCAQNPPCRTTYPGANLAPHLCIAHAHAHFCHLHKNCALLTKTRRGCERCCVASPWPRWPAPNTH